VDKDWVPQSGQGIIYGMVLGAIEWTELEGVIGTADWTGLDRTVSGGKREMTVRRNGSKKKQQ